MFDYRAFSLSPHDNLIIRVGTKDGWTALALAASAGREGVVKALSAQKDVNPYKVDADGRTPLSWAAENGNEGIVKMLPEREGVGPSQVNTSYH